MVDKAEKIKVIDLAILKTFECPSGNCTIEEMRTWIKLIKELETLKLYYTQNDPIFLD